MVNISRTSEKQTGRANLKLTLILVLINFSKIILTIYKFSILFWNRSKNHSNKEKDIKKVLNEAF